MGELAVTVFIGIDPGLTGAVAVITPADAYVWDIPTMLKGEGSVKQEINVRAMYDYLSKVTVFNVGEEIVAALERVNSMPGMAASSVFSLGDSFACCRSALACANIPTTYVTPQKWKKYFDIPKDKEVARALAIKKYPGVELHLKKHIDRAEALLIATYLKEHHHA